MTGLEKTATILAAVGAINWALFSFNWNLIEKVLGGWPVIAKHYLLVNRTIRTLAISKSFQIN